MEMTIAELAENYGTLDLLTAYIMRTAGVDEELAADWVVDVDGGLERILEEKKEASWSRYTCKECGQVFWFEPDDFDCHGSFHPDGEEVLWGHIQLDHPDIFEEVCDLETPYMMEECYDWE